MQNRKLQSYILCTAPRSGSTLLCKLLKATGIAGCPESHFHVPSFEGWLSTHDLDASDFPTKEAAISAVIEAARKAGRGRSNVFGLRMQRASFDYFMAQLEQLAPDRTSDVERIEAVFGPTLFIHLKRPDKLDQAISLVRAKQSGLWHRWSDGSDLERLSPAQEPGFNASEISRTISELTAYDTDWEQWFKQQNLSPVRIDYDALSDNPQNALATCLAALGLDPSGARTVAAPTARLADGQNARWREMYKALK